MLNAGDLAPNVTLTDDNGGSVELQSLLNKPLVLYFYPKDNTPGCTAEACAFRDAYESFLDAGADVIGVSGDDERSHANFRKKFQLPFRLMSDRDGSAQRAFGIRKTLGILPGRVTFVISRDSRIVYAFDSAFAPQKHVSTALAALTELTKGSPQTN